MAAQPRRTECARAGLPLSARTRRTGSELFIVDNGDDDWKVVRCLHDWCQPCRAIVVATSYFEINGLLWVKDGWQRVDRVRILLGKRVAQESCRVATVTVSRAFKRAAGRGRFVGFPTCIRPDRWVTDNDVTTLSLRDTGPYSTRNTAKGALVTEAAQVFAALGEGMTVEQVRDAVLTGSLLTRRSVNSRKGIWDRLHYRYLTHRIDWILSALVEALRAGPHSPEFLSLLYLHYALRDRLTHDFVVEVLWQKDYVRRPLIPRNDVLNLLDAKALEHPEIERWTESSRVKLAGNMLSALRDFGVLEGKQKKLLVRPLLPLSTAKHLLRILIAEGKRGREVMENLSWRLFLLTEQEVVGTLGNLAQAGEIRFEKAGSTVVLQVPEDWEDSRE